MAKQLQRIRPGTIVTWTSLRGSITRTGTVVAFVGRDEPVPGLYPFAPSTKNKLGDFMEQTYFDRYLIEVKKKDESSQYFCPHAGRIERAVLQQEVEKSSKSYAIFSLKDRDLDKAVYEHVMGHPTKNATNRVPYYRMDYNHLQRMESKLKDLDLFGYYILHLLDIVSPCGQIEGWWKTTTPFTLSAIEGIRSATFTQCCHAALLAVEHKGELQK